MTKKILFATVTSFLTLTFIGQSSQKGGFIYGWQNYDNSNDQGLGSRLIEWDSTNMEHVIHAPATGVHPRVYFGPSEIPEIKSRLDNTVSGNSIKATLHAYTTLLHLGSGYSQNASYALDSNGERYISNNGLWNMEPFYTMLKNGDPTVWDNATIKQRHQTATLMSHEAFMCLMYPNDFDNDVNISYADRIQDLGDAMYFWANLALQDPNVNSSSNNYNNFGGTHMALCYDLIYDYLSTQQRDSIRAALVKIIPDHPRHGGEMICYANTSNWTTLNSFEIITNLAIENESGYKQTLTEEWMRAYHNFITYGWYPSGAGYEGLGKNYQFVTTMIACAKRGYSLLSHPHVRAFGEEFLPAIMQPFGEGFTSYDVWGGSGYDEEKGMYKFNSSDAVGLKWAFPNSSKIDFVWRNYIESSNENGSTGYVYAQIRPDDSYNNYLIPAAVFCRDYNNQNWQSTADQVIEDHYFADDRGLAIFKSGSHKNDLSMQFHARHDMGGHTHGDRLDFTLSGLGRIWVRKSYGGSPFQPSYFHSMVLVDDLGMGVGDPDGDKCRQPATILNYEEGSELSKVSADATYAYSWEWHWSPQDMNTDHPWLGSNGWTEVEETWNDFLYNPISEPQYNIPFYDYPHWHQAGKYEKMIKRPYNPMEKVVRNVGMFKGNHPMLLVVDDVKKDDSIRNYKWVAQIARDLEWESYNLNLNYSNYQCDIILKEPASIGNRRLLVRVLESTNIDSLNAPGYIDTLTYENFFSGATYNSNPNWDRHRLVIESISDAPNFKVLLFPFESGDELPITNWNNSRDTLEINFTDQNQIVVFTQDQNDNTDFNIYDPAAGINNLDDLLINIYPNPTNCEFTISSYKAIDKIEIFDVRGKMVWGRSEIYQNTVHMNNLNLPKGSYIVEVSDETGKVTTQKAVIK